MGPAPNVTGPLDLGAEVKRRAACGNGCLAPDQDAGEKDSFCRMGRLRAELAANDNLEVCGRAVSGVHPGRGRNDQPGTSPTDSDML